MSTIYIDRDFHGVQTFPMTEKQVLHCLARKTLMGTIIYACDDIHRAEANMPLAFYLPHTQQTVTLGATTYYIYG